MDAIGRITKTKNHSLFIHLQKPFAARTERARTRRKSDPFESPVFGDLLVRLEKVEMNDLKPLFSFVLHEGQGITSMNELML